jgi:hypothetical protein
MTYVLVGLTCFPYLAGGLTYEPGSEPEVRTMNDVRLVRATRGS